MNETAASSPILELRGVNKSFGPVHVLHDVDFKVYPGQVTALVGDNGAGKSTLVKSLVGVYTMDSGEILFEGQPVTINTPKDAAALGIEVVYQDLALCDNLDIVQNMFLGREIIHSGLLDEPAMETSARKTLNSLSVRTVTSARQSVSSLSGGQRQTVAIAKAVLWNSKVVLLDEPTAALGVAQTRQVLDLVRRLAGQGLGVVIITHNMVDVFEVADRIVPLFLGRVTADLARRRYLPLASRRAHHRGPLGRRGHRPRRAGPDLTEARMATTTTEPVEPTAGGGFALDEERPSIYSSLRASLLGTGGDMGARPAIAGLIALFILFGLGADKFASKANFANLITQSTWVMILAVGVTFVLLLGEIDLSAGYTAGVCVVTIAWLIYQHNVSAWIAIPIGFMIGAAIGTLTGFLVAKVGIPAFVATLAFFLAWQGVVLQIAREGGTIPINNTLIIALVNRNLSPALGWVLWAIVVLGYLGMALSRARGRAKAGLCARAHGSDRHQGARHRRPAGAPGRTS